MNYDCLQIVSIFILICFLADSSSGKCENKSSPFKQLKEQLDIELPKQSYLTHPSSTNVVLSSSISAKTTSNSNVGFNKCPPIMKRKACFGYAGKWVSFYVKIGGWITLSVITIGSFLLITTQIFSKRFKYYGNERLQKIHSMEISSKDTRIAV